MNVINTITIDLNRPRKNVVHLGQSDNTHQIALTLLSNGVPYDVTADAGGATINKFVKYIKSNGVDGSYDTTSTGVTAVVAGSASNKWTVTLDEHATDFPGFAEVFVVFATGSGKILHSFPITVDVVKTTSGKTDPGQPYYNNAAFVMVANQATKTSAMTQRVGIDAVGRLWVPPGGGGGGSGAELFVVDIDGQSVPSASYSEIYAAWSDGAICKLRNAIGIEYDLQTISQTEAIFSTAVDAGSYVLIDSYTIQGSTATHNSLSGYVKPSGGIPASDLAAAVQTSLGLADTSYQKPQSGIPSSDLAANAKPFFVTITSNGSTLTADKSESEILAAATANQIVKAKTPNGEGDLASTDDGAEFIVISGGSSSRQIYRFVIDGTTVSVSSFLAYKKPSGGIPKTDLASAVQTSLGKADSSVQGTSDTEVPGGAFEPVDMSADVTITDGENWRQAGHSGSAENWWRTNKLAVVPGYTYRFVNFPLYMYQYDSTGGNGVAGQLNSETDATYTVPTGIYYIGFYQQHPVKTGIQMFRLTPTPEEETATENVVKADGLSLMVSNIKRDSTTKLLCPLKGKKIVQFGDSIIGKFSTPEDVSTYLADLSGATVYNCGFGGTKMATHANANYALFSFHALIDAVIAEDFSAQDAALASSWEAPDEYAERLATLKAVDWSTVDIVTISYGTNDWMSAISVDNSSNLKDVTTYLGSFRYGVEKLLTAYPGLRIYPTTPIFRTHLDDTTHAFIENSDTWVNASGKTIPDFCDALMAASETYKFVCVDNYWQTGFNELTRTLYFRPNDGTHPSAAGREIIAQNIFNAMMSSGAMGYGGNAKGYLTLADLPIYNGGVS